MRSHSPGGPNATFRTIASVALATSHITADEFSGRAIALDSTVIVAGSGLSQRPQPAHGGLLQGLTSGAGDTSETTALVTDLDVSLGVLTITADVLESTATANCADEGAMLEGNSTITNLVIGGEPLWLAASPTRP